MLMTRRESQRLGLDVGGCRNAGCLQIGGQHRSPAAALTRQSNVPALPASLMGCTPGHVGPCSLAPHGAQALAILAPLFLAQHKFTRRTQLAPAHLHPSQTVAATTSPSHLSSLFNAQLWLLFPSLTSFSQDHITGSNLRGERVHVLLLLPFYTTHLLVHHLQRLLLFSSSPFLPPTSLLNSILPGGRMIEGGKGLP